MERGAGAVLDRRRLSALGFRFLGGLLLLGFLTLGAVGRPAQAADDPKAFVAEFAKEGLALLADEDATPAQREAAFRDLLERYFDLQRTGRITLGRHWRNATEDERAEYQKLFNDYVVVSTTRRLEGYAQNTLEVEGARPLNDNEILVDSRFTTASSEPVRVQWNLYRGDSGLRILDVSIEGVSQVLTQRNEFDSVIRSGGDGIQSLLELLRKQTAGAATAPS